MTSVKPDECHTTTRWAGALADEGPDALTA